ncbi:hypothetical protein B7R21_18635 [Subtercola boreus]|uniref:Uncharacterized protein n=1 Tax=Subtercola boreus TaxID=120213 RepID=A0A3E0VB81_9MICO|nr:hypothetical protein B7R21_18635 [Subtercola boreus]
MQIGAVQAAAFITGYQLTTSPAGTFLAVAVQDQADGSRVRALFGTDERIPSVSGIGLFYPDANGNQLYKEL